MEQAPTPRQPETTPPEANRPLDTTVEFPPVQNTAPLPTVETPEEETQEEAQPRGVASLRRRPTVTHNTETTTTVAGDIPLSSNTRLSTRRTLRGRGVVMKHTRRTPVIGRKLTETKTYVGNVAYDDVDTKARLMEGDIELGFERALQIHNVSEVQRGILEEKEAHAQISDPKKRPETAFSEVEHGMDLGKAAKSLSIAGLTWTDPATHKRHRVMYEDYGLDKKGRWNERWVVDVQGEKEPSKLSNAEIVKRLGTMLGKDMSQITERPAKDAEKKDGEGRDVKEKGFIVAPVTEKDVETAGEARQQQYQQRQNLEDTKLAMAAAQLEATQRLVELQEQRLRDLEDARASVAAAHESNTDDSAEKDKPVALPYEPSYINALEAMRAWVRNGGDPKMAAGAVETALPNTELEVKQEVMTDLKEMNFIDVHGELAASEEELRKDQLKELLDTVKNNEAYTRVELTGARYTMADGSRIEIAGQYTDDQLHLRYAVTHSGATNGHPFERKYKAVTGEQLEQNLLSDK